MTRHARHGRLLAVAMAVLVASCSSGPPPRPTHAPATTPAPSQGRSEAVPARPTPEAAASDASASPVSPDPVASAPPAWLGTRVLESGPTGFPPPQTTPADLWPRSLVTPDRLPPPPGDEFVSSVDTVPDEVLARSTWHAGCPVAADELRYVTVSFLGFDGSFHTGEVLVHVDEVDAVVAIFEALHRTAFPLEDVAIITPALLTAPATGDGNITSAFVCRDSRGSGSWSEHAHGRALDINPFHNPYVRDHDEGLVVLPELATAYTDRSLGLPGMLTDGHPVVDVIQEVGWHWGGHYRSVSDPMHVSATGR